MKKARTNFLPKPEYHFEPLLKDICYEIVVAVIVVPPCFSLSNMIEQWKVTLALACDLVQLVRAIHTEGKLTIEIME